MTVQSLSLDDEKEQTATITFPFILLKVGTAQESGRVLETVGFPIAVRTLPASQDEGVWKQASRFGSDDDDGWKSAWS